MVANTSHPSFTQPGHTNISLWRYMDLSKFVSMLQNASLVFPRADNLGDPFEGSSPSMMAEIPRFLKELRKTNPKIHPYPDKNDDFVDNIYSQIRSIRRLSIKNHYISCWHINEYESSGMWKVYSKSDEAVCIKTTYSILSELLPDYCYMGLVKYVDWSTYIMSQGNLFDPFLIKRKSFEYEQEARVIITDHQALSKLQHGQETDIIKSINIDIKKLIQAIYVSPDSPSWFHSVVQSLANTYGLNITVGQSSLAGNPTY